MFDWLCSTISVTLGISNSLPGPCPAVKGKFFFFLFFLFCDQDPNKNLASLDNIMQMVDPYNNQHITFSEAVGALSAELVTMMTRKRMDNR